MDLVTELHGQRRNKILKTDNGGSPRLFLPLEHIATMVNNYIVLSGSPSSKSSRASLSDFLVGVSRLLKLFVTARAICSVATPRALLVSYSYQSY